MLSFPRRVVDRFVPDALRGTLEERQARALIGLVLMVLAVSPVSAMLGTGAWSVERLIAVLMNLLFVIPVLVLRRTKSAYWGGFTYATLAAFGALTTLTLRGFDSSSSGYLMTSAMVMVIVASPLAGALFGTMLVGVAAVMTYLQFEGIVPPGAKPMMTFVVSMGCWAMARGARPVIRRPAAEAWQKSRRVKFMVGSFSWWMNLRSEVEHQPG